MPPPAFRCVLCCYLLWAVALWPGTARGAELATDGTRFTLDGKPTFLLGCSYYAGLGASGDTLGRDLDELRRHGFNWVRVWATWSGFDHDVSAVDGDGNPRAEYVERLKRVVDECDRRGMVVDVTLSRGDGARGSPRLEAIGPHRRAVGTILDTIGDRKNWYIDLGNERNVRDKRFVSFEDLALLRDVVKRRDPKRLVTASHTGDPERRDVERYLRDVRVDFISVHRPRDAKSPDQTAEKTKQVMGWIREIGPVVPLHYDEPFRRGYADWQPAAAVFEKDLAAARVAGAAGWCFHNGSQRGAAGERPRRSFDLSEHGLIEQLDEQEREFLARLLRWAGPKG
jgi:hypothetical protein